MAFFFIQMSDPQFGMFASRDAAPDDGSFPETPLYEAAIAAANRLKPAFVVITGDLVQVPTDAEQHAELIRITGQLDESIPMRLAPGNADLGNTPSAESLARYRGKFGEDYYSFDHQGSHFVVVNSCLAFDPSDVEDEWDRELTFLRDDLSKARGAEHIVLFMHHPLFGDSADEPDGLMAIPKVRRQAILEIAHENGVSATFAGHWHKTNESSDGAMAMVVTGPVGYPAGDDPSGLRIVKVYDDRIEHEYFGMDDIPPTVTL